MKNRFDNKQVVDKDFIEDLYKQIEDLQSALLKILESTQHHKEDGNWYIPFSVIKEIVLGVLKVK